MGRSGLQGGYGLQLVHERIRKNEGASAPEGTPVKHGRMKWGFSLNPVYETRATSVCGFTTDCVPGGRISANPTRNTP